MKVQKINPVLLMGLMIFGLVASLFSGSELSAQSAQTLTTQKSPSANTDASPSKRSIPRFVSLKKDRVNVRRGPSTSHKVDFAFTKKGLPVEVIAEFDLWRRIRDSEGDEGWVYHTLLSSHRTVLIAPWNKKKTMPLLKSDKEDSATIAYAETGVLGSVAKCNGKRCLLVIGGDEKGWIAQASLWGVYPNEVF